MIRLCRAPFVHSDPPHRPGPWEAAREELHQISMWAKWWVAGMLAPPVPLYRDRIELLRGAARAAPREGLWLEFGVYRGESVRALAPIAPGTVYGFDSFQGLPDAWTPGYPGGTFDLRGGLPPVDQNVTLVKGWFAETIPPFLGAHPNEAVSLLHVDCDLYESARTVLSEVAPRWRDGTVVVFDEFEGLLPDTEGRAFREALRGTDWEFRFLGASLSGSVSVQLRRPPARMASRSR